MIAALLMRRRSERLRAVRVERFPLEVQRRNNLAPKPLPLGRLRWYWHAMETNDLRGACRETTGDGES